MFRPAIVKAIESIQPSNDKVILNFALDTRSFLSSIINNAYTFLSAFGDLKDAKLFDAVALSEKLASEPNYIIQLKLKEFNTSLSEEEKQLLNTIDLIKKYISEAQTIFIMGHCEQGQVYLKSDSTVETHAELIKYFFPKNMQGKNLDLIACESIAFGEALAKDLLDQTKKVNGINCDGILISAKTFVTIPLPSGESLYYKKNAFGLPTIFKNDRNYRKDFLITKDGIISESISNEADVIRFKEKTQDYRNSKDTIIKKPV